uniref:SJCHGC03077 protein n=1 Tax=Schistosoma japonicum TaxID=6182 RepID=Q5DER4_SCHJA|nr:SJCHGC03077 protein [Schistosoma japonicum]
MAIQVSTLSEYPKMYLVTLNRAITSNINDLNGNNNFISMYQKSVSESAVDSIWYFKIPNETMTAYMDCYQGAYKNEYNPRMLKSLKYRLEQILNDFDKLNQNLLESWRRKFDELKRTTTETQSNETEASCSRLAPSSEYDLKSFKKDMSLLQMRLSLNVRHLFINELLTNFTNEVKSKIRPVTTEAYR